MGDIYYFYDYRKRRKRPFIDDLINFNDINKDMGGSKLIFMEDK